MISYTGPDMYLEIKQGNLLESEASGIILTIDGAAKGLEGNIARAFGHQFPDAWEELEDAIQYPVPLGTSGIYKIEEDLDCDFRYAIVASTLHHIETFTEEEKLQVIRSALSSALSLASSKGVGSLACGIFSGGWRLDSKTALSAMIETYHSYIDGRDTYPALIIYILSHRMFAEIKEIFQDYCDTFTSVEF